MIDNITTRSSYISNVTTGPSRPVAAGFIAHETPPGGGASNFAHPFFPGRQAQWLYNELQRPFTGGNYYANPVGCSSECAVFSIANSLAPQRLCGSASATFSIPNLPAGTTVTWSATPAGNFTVATGSGSTFTTSASANAAGNGPITAAIGGCQVASLTLRTGSGEPNGYYNSSGYSGPLTTYQTVGPGGVDGIDVGVFITDPYNFSFTSDMPGLYLTETQGSSTHFILKQGQGVTITATATNASPCGVVGHYVFAYPNPYYFAATPNPASEVLTVTAIDSHGTTDNAPSPTAPPFDVDLYDGRGKKVKTEKSAKGRASIDVRDLPNGLYHLRAGKGKEALAKQIQISH